LRALPLHAGGDLGDIRDEFPAKPLCIARAGLLLLGRALRGGKADRTEEAQSGDRPGEGE
jgi:hypothetical protein